MKNTNKNYRKRSKKKPVSIDKALPIKRLRTVLITAVILLILLVLRIFWLQFIKGDWLKEKAYRQQKYNVTHNSKHTKNKYNKWTKYQV